ncbi:hypothetical protein HRR83_006458 [Exophiala dermatitidis]|uniref:Vps72/YL1 C-terminal domain-containing protein n=2 Tax=Exophiala dermatitidis TaxID=5970 RepID=H6CAD4_EXODN|nr:uncharacterized protein HMPREF1120_08070 [Exophiala dermatitidis NIH/UT8656]KAJ4503624.1 hypothetical protein HRR75_008018 [Exophiala dermatitidis]EHY60098.1 hypothetical protein HMPREF1120_08070 [Exophiala dermatitidis NIH/UT8656]KAJ4504559.1 hypothetical protein HRR73_008733 [Exophiala dermatitidis]KAJ4505356.1 hypothetical protein HRR74_008727 [Exophiala dermatitidis]KAJ4530657.1 hypothetical protein HRR76_008356 [Exophiala dermatitidis]
MAEDDDTPVLSHTDSDSDGSEDESSDEPVVETLIAGRERRKTAGNRYDRDLLLEEAAAAADEDADEVTLLFADADDEEDDEFKSDEEDEDADLSSSDDDDQGPNVAPDDLEGEKEIQKHAKEERAKKRRADLALTSVAGIRKKLKTDPTRPGGLSTQAKPSKKKERVTWVHEPDSGRSSLRKQTIAHRAETIARLKESEAQSKKLKALKEQRDRERAKDAPKELTQADRLAEAARVERQNATSLNRWEAMEKKRQEEQAAKLAALKDRKLEGPVITWWSARAQWIGPRLHKIGTKDAGDVIEGGVETKKRGRKSKAFLEQQAAAKEAEVGALQSQKENLERPPESQTPAAATTAGAPTDSPATAVPMGPHQHEPLTTPHAAKEPSQDTVPLISDEGKEPSNTTVSTTSNEVKESPTGMLPDAAPPTGAVQPQDTTITTTQEQEDTFLKGIHEYATLGSDINPPGKEVESSAPQTCDSEQQVEPKPEPKTEENPEERPEQKTEQKAEKRTELEDVSNNNSLPTVETHENGKKPPEPLSNDAMKPENSSRQSTEPAKTDEPAPTVPPAAEPVSAVDASPAPDTPSLAVIASDPKPPVAQISSDAAAASASASDKSAEPVPVAVPQPEPEPEPSTRNLVILEKFEELADEARQEYSFFFNTHTRRAAKPAKQKHTQELCPITALPVRYRDPETGIGYANVVGYKKLQELKQHGFAWSSMLGCYVGRDGGIIARGVPEGFAGSK